MMLLIKAKPAGAPVAAKKPAPASKPGQDPKEYLKDDLASLMDKSKQLGSPKFVGLLAVLQEHGAGGQFGAHNVAPGDQVAFAAGEFKGAGEVCAAGKHGATVKDAGGREHRVHWHEVTGHQPGKGAAKGKRDDAK